MVTFIKSGKNNFWKWNPKEQTRRKKSLGSIFLVLKPKGKLAIIVGDSTVSGRKIPTTMMTKNFCEEVGFKFEKLIFNPLLGARNRAIRGESIIICEKP